MTIMSRMFFMNLLLGIGVSSTFSCGCMCNQLCETKITSPSLALLTENFRSGSDEFVQQTNEALKNLENVHSDDARLLSLKMQQNLRTIALLMALITTCKDDLNKTLNQAEKQKALQICQYLAGMMPYAGEMQDVILSVLKEEFDVNSVGELALIAAK